VPKKSERGPPPTAMEEEYREVLGSEMVDLLRLKGDEARARKDRESLAEVARLADEARAQKDRAEELLQQAPVTPSSPTFSPVGEILPAVLTEVVAKTGPPRLKVPRGVPAASAAAKSEEWKPAEWMPAPPKGANLPRVRAPAPAVVASSSAAAAAVTSSSEGEPEGHQECCTCLLPSFQKQCALRDCKCHCCYQCLGTYLPKLSKHKICPCHVDGPDGIHQIHWRIIQERKAIAYLILDAREKEDNQTRGDEPTIVWRGDERVMTSEVSAGKPDPPTSSEEGEDDEETSDAAEPVEVIVEAILQMGHATTAPTEHPSRPQCLCVCGCKHRPGKRKECALCKSLVGPGCCMMPTGNCHMCQKIIDESLAEELDCQKSIDESEADLMECQKIIDESVADRLDLPEKRQRLIVDYRGENEQCLPEEASSSAAGPVSHRDAPLPDVLPEEPASTDRIKVLANLKKNHKWTRRGRLLKKAQLWAEENRLSQSDIYLLNWFLGGASKCFDKTSWDRDPEASYAAMWAAVNDRETMQKIVASPVFQYTSKMLDDGPWDPGVEFLVVPANIYHTVSIVVDTLGRVYKFTKFLDGGGSWDKSATHAHHSCQDAAEDELGIGFHNLAIVAISPPSLMVVPTPKKDRWDKENQMYRPATRICWVQILVVDADQVEKIPETESPIEMGQWKKIPVQGEWGHFRIGGEKMRCRENETYHKNFGTAFVREPLKDIRNGQVEWHKDDARVWQSWMTNWREIDYVTLYKYRDDALKFVADYNASKATSEDWADRDREDARDRILGSSAGSGETAMRTIPGTEETDRVPDHYGYATAKRMTEAERVAEDLPVEAMLQMDQHLENILSAMNMEKGVWQRPWPDLPPVILRMMRDHPWGQMIQRWPVGRTLAGNQVRNLERITDLLDALKQEVIHGAGLLAPTKWEASNDVARSQYFQDLKQGVKEAQLQVLEDHTPATAVPPFDEERAGGNPGIWNYMEPTEIIGKRQEFKPIIQDAIPDHRMLDEFFTMRKDRHGRPVIEMFHQRIDHADDWCEYPNASFDMEKLPKRSKGQHNWYGKPEYMDGWHGIKTEGAYALISTMNEEGGGLNASDDKDEGHRHLDGAPGVYFHRPAQMEKAFNYGRWVPLFSDGTYVRVALQLVVDRAHRIVHKHHDQKMQHPNSKCQSSDEEGTCRGPSVFIKSVWVQHRGYNKLALGEEIAVVWNPALEARPPWMQDQSGAPRERLRKVVWCPDESVRAKRSSSVPLAAPKSARSAPTAATRATSSTAAGSSTEQRDLGTELRQTQSVKFDTDRERTIGSLGSPKNETSEGRARRAAAEDGSTDLRRKDRDTDLPLSRTRSASTPLVKAARTEDQLGTWLARHTRQGQPKANWLPSPELGRYHYMGFFQRADWIAAPDGWKRICEFLAHHPEENEVIWTRKQHYGRCQAIESNVFFNKPCYCCHVSQQHSTGCEPCLEAWNLMTVSRGMKIVVRNYSMNLPPCVNLEQAQEHVEAIGESLKRLNLQLAELRAEEGSPADEAMPPVPEVPEEDPPGTGGNAAGTRQTFYQSDALPPPLPDETIPRWRGAPIPEQPSPDTVETVRRGSLSTSLDEDIVMKDAVMPSDEDVEEISPNQVEGESLEEIEAGAAGLDTMVVPAPLEGCLRYDGATPWRVLWLNDVNRFLPGMEDMEILEVRGVPSEEAMRDMADQTIRALYDVRAGQPYGRENFDSAPSGEFPLDPHVAEQFDEYVEQFFSMVDYSDEFRKEWKSLVQDDDPIYYDELEVRSVEAKAMRDLQAKGAKIRSIQELLYDKDRYNPVKGSNLLWSLQQRSSTLGKLKKSYLRILKEMRQSSEPSAYAALGRIIMLVEKAVTAQRREVLTPLDSSRGVVLVSRARENVAMDDLTQPQSIVALALREKKEKKIGTFFSAWYQPGEDKGNTLRVTLIRDLSPPVLASPQVSPRSGEPKPKQELPALDEGEMSRLLDRQTGDLLKLGGAVTTSLLDIKQDSAAFEIVCQTSRAAHLVARHLQAYRLMGPDGAMYEMEIVQRKSEEQMQEDEGEQDATLMCLQSQYREPEAGEVQNDPNLKGRGLFRKKHGNTPADEEGFIQRFAEDPDYEIIICRHCSKLADFEYLSALRKEWEYNEETRVIGVKCACHQQTFCTEKCLEAHRIGDTPAVPPEWLRCYDEQEGFARGQQLCLYQAYARRKHYDEGEARRIDAEINQRNKKIEEQSANQTNVVEERTLEEVAAGGAAFGGISRVLASIVIRLGTGELGSKNAGQDLLKKAKAVNRTMAGELREEIRRIEPDDPDRALKIYELKVAAVMKPRINTDRRTGKYSDKEVNKRHHERVRSHVTLAQKFNGLPKKSTKGESIHLAIDPREKRKREAGAKARNQTRKKKMLTVVASLCNWYVGALADDPQAQSVALEWRDSDEAGDLELIRQEARDILKLKILERLKPSASFSVLDCGMRTGFTDGPCALPKGHWTIYDCVDTRVLRDEDETEDELFEAEECLEEAIGNDAPKRAKVAHQEFDEVYSRCRIYGLEPPWGKGATEFTCSHSWAKLFLRILLQQQAAKPQPKRQDKVKRKDPESFEEDDEEKDESSRGSRRRSTTDWQSSLASSSGTGQKRSGEVSYYRGQGEKRRACAGSTAMRCYPCKVVLSAVLVTQIPVLAAAMQVVPVHPVASPWALMSILGTAAWYLAGTSVIVAIPTAVDKLEKEVEGIMTEVATGSKMLVRYTSKGLLLAVVLLIVWGLYWLLRWMGRVLSGLGNEGACRADAFEIKYGGRLKGGGRRSAKEVCGGEPLVRNQVVRSGLMGMVDPDRLAIGDRCSFRYWRGERTGKRRTVTVIGKKVEPQGTRLLCNETVPSVGGSDIDSQTLTVVERWYWPCHTSETEYYGEAATRGDKERGDEPRGPGSSGDGPAPRTTSAAARGQAALGERAKPSKVEVWKAKSLGLIPTFFAKAAEEEEAVEPAVEQEVEEDSIVKQEDGEIETAEETETSNASFAMVRSEKELSMLNDRKARLIQVEAWPKMKDVADVKNFLGQICFLSGRKFSAPVSEQVKVLRKVRSGEKFQIGCRELAAVLMLQRLVSEEERTGEHEAFYSESFRETGSHELAVIAAINEATAKSIALRAAKNRGTRPLGFLGQTLQVIRGIPERTPQFYTGGLILPAMLVAFESINESFAAWCYQIDHTELCNLLVSKLLCVHEETNRRCKGRIIFDKDNFFYSSCARQAARVGELWKAGCEMRTHKPRGGGFACMHTKTWIIDDEIIYSGSVNLTHNGLENNKEHLWKILGEKAITPLKEDFEETWMSAERVTSEHIARMRSADAKRKLKRSDSAPVNRSLCEAMEAAS